ncbi:MAG: DUF3619 family protein [Rhodocyclaceae bacterium]|jgi:hypothetical protein
MKQEQEREFAYKVRHHLNLGTDAIDRDIAEKLFVARQGALSHQKAAGARLSLAGSGHLSTGMILSHARHLAIVLGLVLGVFGISAWNDLRKADELGQIDSALLADDLPINAYIDRGFQAWLSERSSQD